MTETSKSNSFHKEVHASLGIDYKYKLNRLKLNTAATTTTMTCLEQIILQFQPISLPTIDHNTKNSYIEPQVFIHLQTLVTYVAKLSSGGQNIQLNQSIDQFKKIDSIKI